MAEQKRTTIRLTWNKDEFFEMEAKEAGAEDFHQVVRLEENGHIEDLFDYAEDMANTYMKQTMARIKSEMLTEEA